MLDQGFNARNFKRIFDIENRRGRNLEEFFAKKSPGFEKLRELTLEIKQARAKRDSARHAFHIEASVENKAALSDADKHLMALKDKKDNNLDEELNRIASSIVSNPRVLSLVKRTGPNNKDVYLSDGSPETFFIEKQLQNNIARLYRVKQANRDEVVSQVIGFVSGDLPLWGLRIDIQNFYESIDQRAIIRKLKEDQLLDSPSVRFIQQILFSYRQLSQSDLGIPRGNGISAYLSELYMRSLDKELMGLDNLLYCGRYVDDIILLFIKTPESSQEIILKQVTAAVESRELALNTEKTKPFDTSIPSGCKFSFLGYDFTVKSGNCLVDISYNKFKKLEDRLLRSFAACLDSHPRKAKAATKLLEMRVKYLTTNTRLFNTKSNAYVGVYYSHRHVNKPDRFTGLDFVLSHQISKIADARIRLRLAKQSFVNGFNEQRYSYFTAQEFTKIVRLWKYD
ncbi:MAG: hypothetical protein DI546_08700 [Rhizobium sp.]|nr:MAG: hypothetical protein DI546_08700 [Rhizobium sp.]